MNIVLLGLLWDWDSGAVILNELIKQISIHCLVFEVTKITEKK